MKKIQFDGAAIPNPGPMGIGIVLIEDDTIVKEISKKLDGEGSNNCAEYNALICGLEEAIILGWTDVTIEGDSLLIINQVTGKNKVKSENLKLLHKKATKHLSKFQHYEIMKIPNKDNAKADKLACMALGYEEDPYHKFNKTLNSNALKKDEEISISELTCPKCGLELQFSWQEFKDGSRHIRKKCSKHGYLGYAPQKEPFISKCKKASSTQKTLFELQ